MGRPCAAQRFSVARLRAVQFDVTIYQVTLAVKGWRCVKCEVVMSTTVLPLLTVADLDALPEDDRKYELIGGELYVSRAPHIHHQLVVSNITGTFFVYLSKFPLGKIAPGPGVI